MSWIYDSFGNRTGESFAGTTGASLPASTTAQYNGNNQVTGVSIAYDAAGNVAADNANQYLYDADGHVCAVLDRTYGDMTGYLYNAEGQRVAKGSLTTFTCDMTANGFVLTRESVLGQGGEQLAELALDESGRMAWHHTNVYAAGALFASYDPNGLHFLVTDWLGTRRAQTDYAGVLEQTCQSLPFGNGETCSPTPSSQLFTTYQRDAESGNDYAQARYYASSQGRFLSPDPSGLTLADITNPQSFNLYAYVMNNPLRFVDPSGLILCDYGPHDDGSEDKEDADSSKECTKNGGKVVTDQTVVTVRADGNSGCLGDCGEDPMQWLYNYAMDQYYNALRAQAGQVYPETLRSGVINGVAKDTKSIKCTQVALGKNGTATALDAAGIIPAEGTVLKGIQFGAAITSAGMNVFGKTNPTDFALSGTGIGIAVVDKAKVMTTGAKAVPVAGNIVSGFATYHDIMGDDGMVNSYKSCMAGD